MTERGKKMKRFTDTDLREALRRKAENRPPVVVPDDFADQILGKINATKSKSVSMWRWVAAAACIVLIIGIGSALFLLSNDYTLTQNPVAVVTDTIKIDTANTQQHIVAEIVTPQKPAETEKQATMPEPKKNTAKTTAGTKTIAEKSAIESIPESESSDTCDDDDDDADYQSPARMNEFISLLATNQGAEKTILDCSLDNDSNSVEMFYIFPEKNNFDLFGRLLLSASNFPDTTEGYFLNYSQQQFFFCLGDERSGQNYLWIAERLSNDKTILYCSHSTSGMSAQSDCYQNVHNKLIINDINTITNL